MTDSLNNDHINDPFFRCLGNLVPRTHCCQVRSGHIPTVGGISKAKYSTDNANFWACLVLTQWWNRCSIVSWSPSGYYRQNISLSFVIFLSIPWLRELIQNLVHTKVMKLGSSNLVTKLLMLAVSLNTKKCKILGCTSSIHWEIIPLTLKQQTYDH